MIKLLLLLLKDVIAIVKVYLLFLLFFLNFISRENTLFVVCMAGACSHSNTNLFIYFTAIVSPLLSQATLSFHSPCFSRNGIVVICYNVRFLLVDSFS